MGETGLLVVLGFAIVAFGAIYRIIEENLTSIAWVPAIACSLFVLARLFSWLGRNRPDDVQLGTVAPPIDVNQTVQRERVEPRVVSDSRPRAEIRRTPARWVGLSETILIQGVRVAGGNFYLGTHLVFDGHEIDGYAVNPELSARSEVPDVDGS